MKSMRFALAGVLALVLSGLAHAGILADYRFNNDLTNSNGAAASLATVGPQSGSPFSTATLYGASRGVYTTSGTPGADNNSGLSVDMTGLLSDTGPMTLEMVVSLENLGGWRKLADLSSRTSDAGYYIDPSSRVNVYANVSGTTQIGANQFNYIAFTRDSGVVKGYLNGALEFTSGSLTGGDFLNGSKLMSFFVDDAATSFNEYSNVSVSLLRVRDNVLSDNDIAALGVNPYGAVPEPGTWAVLGLGGVALLRRRRR